MPSLVWPLPIYLDSWTWHSRFLCNIAVYSIRPCFYHQSHPQLWLHPFILSGAISPLISSSILGTYWPEGFIFQYHMFLPFHTFQGVLKARMLKWFAISFSSGPCFIRLSTMTHLSRVALHAMAHCFIELGKVVLHVIISFLWLWFSFCLPSDEWG